MASVLILLPPGPAVGRRRGRLTSPALALALTPVAVVMFRFNNPDALLTLFCLAAAWALWPAIETGRTRRLVVSAACSWPAFDTKMLQAFLVLPAFMASTCWPGRPALARLWSAGPGRRSPWWCPAAGGSPSWPCPPAVGPALRRAAPNNSISA